MRRKRTSLLAALALTIAAGTASSQKKEKPWTEWSKQEAEKVLTNSPWAQTQTDTDTSQMMYSPTADDRMPGVRKTDTTDSRTAQGATNGTVSSAYHVRIFSARPIREAHARLLIIQNKFSPEQVEKIRQTFAEIKAPDSIIITVVFESSDQRTLAPIMQAFNSAATGTLKNNTYLQRSDGKQLFLEEYLPPDKDGFGARFIFLRNPDEEPFFADKSGEIHFVTQFPSNGPKIDRRFKMSDMMYEGAVEF
jgi:hypothetical protein